MKTTGRGFVDILIRVVTVQIAVAVAVVSTVVVALGHREASAPKADSSESSAWSAGYSERFPGCVASLLWPAEESPRAFLVETPKGGITLVSAVTVSSGTVSGAWRPGVSVIGICR